MLERHLCLCNNSTINPFLCGNATGLMNERTQIALCDKQTISIIVQ